MTSSTVGRKIYRVLIVGGFEQQRELIHILSGAYGTNYFSEYTGGKVSRLEYVEREANRIFFVDGYHMYCSKAESWDLILIFPNHDECTQHFIDAGPTTKWLSYLCGETIQELYTHAVNTIVQTLRISPDE